MEPCGTFSFCRCLGYLAKFGRIIATLKKFCYYLMPSLKFQLEDEAPNNLAVVL